MSDETTDRIAAIVREAMDYAADHGRITTPEDYADRIREALATPAAGEDLRERVRQAVEWGIEDAWPRYNRIYDPHDPDDESRQEWVDCITEQVVTALRSEPPGATSGEGEADAGSGGDVTVSQLLAVLDEYSAGVFCMTPENADGTPMFSVAVARGESAERLKQWASEDAEEPAALRSEAQGEAEGDRALWSDVDVWLSALERMLYAEEGDSPDCRAVASLRDRVRMKLRATPTDRSEDDGE